MKIKTLLLLSGLLYGCLFAQFSTTANINTTARNSQISSASAYNISEYTYVRVFENGKWWIYVYDSDGRLINIYLDEDD
jgi:hypothetical protein